MLKRGYVDHRALLAALNQFVNIRYVAYRTAAKLKFLQQQSKLDFIKLSHVYQVVNDFGLRSSEKDLILTRDEIQQLVLDIYMLAQKETLIHLDHKVSAKIAVDLLLETFDKWVLNVHFIFYKFNNINYFLEMVTKKALPFWASWSS